MRNQPALKTPKTNVPAANPQASAGANGAAAGLSAHNPTGLPDALKSGVESLSGLTLDDVHVHYNSPKPAQLQALAYTQGSDIHVGPGQERHLPHEAWHVIQQKQGRVRPTIQAKGVMINDDIALEREAEWMGAKTFWQTQPHQNSSGIQLPGAFSHGKAPWRPTSALGTGLPVQRLMTRAAFLEQRQAVEAQNVRLGRIGDHLNTFAGLNNGNDGDYQLRLRSLRALDTEIHAWLTDFVQYKINDITNGPLMRTLLDESAAAHREIVTAIAADDQLLPIDTTGIGIEAQATILTLWRSIVGGTGNLRITERENVAGFRNRMLAAIAQILQGSNGRQMITEINRGGEQAAQRIILSSSFTQELAGTQRVEAAKNEAIPLSGLDNDNKAYELRYIAPQAAAEIDPGQISDYGGNVNDMEAYNRFLMENTRPYIRYRNAVHRVGQGTGSYVRIHNQGSSTLAGETDQEVFTPEFVTLAHELGHANRLRKGAAISGTLDELGVPEEEQENLWTNSEEFVNIKGVENSIRNEHGISRRKYHSASPSGVRNVKTYWRLNRRVGAAMHDLGPSEVRIASDYFPDYAAWEGIPYTFPAQDFSDPLVVNRWTPVVQNIEAFGPTYIALVGEGLIPELMYENARAMLKKVIDEDDEFSLYRFRFNSLMRRNDGAAFARDARAIAQAAKARLASLDIEAAKRSSVLMEDEDFNIIF